LPDSDSGPLPFFVILATSYVQRAVCSKEDLSLNSTIFRRVLQRPLASPFKLHFPDQDQVLRVIWSSRLSGAPPFRIFFVVGFFFFFSVSSLRFNSSKEESVAEEASLLSLPQILLQACQEPTLVSYPLLVTKSPSPNL